MFIILCKGRFYWVRLRFIDTDEIGFVAIPKYTNTVEDKPLSARAKRMVCTIDTLVSFIMHFFQYGAIFIPNSLFK
jgi:hypothetical protein